MSAAGKPAYRFRLGTKLALFTTTLVLLVSASVAYFMIVQADADRRAAMERRVAGLGAIVGGVRGTGYERRFDPSLVKMLVQTADRMGTELCFAIFQDADGRLDGGEVNLNLLRQAAPQLAAGLENLSADQALRRLAEWKFGSESIRPFTIRIMAGDRGAGDAKGAGVLGRAMLGFSTYNLERQIEQALRTNLAVTAVAFLLGVFGALWMARRFVRPIRRVASAMQAVSEGQLDQTLAVTSRDEIGVLAQTFNFMTRGLRERERILHTFARYVSDQVAERILREEDELDLHGELRRVTVLFLDIRGFTSVSEFMAPREVVGLLNDYFGIIIDIIFKNEGTVNKFIGDSIMAIYGAPATLDIPEFRAVMTAVEIQRAVGAFNWQRMQEGKSTVNFGIGIHSGEAIAGNVGSARRMEYTVIGRDVNLAQRIEAATHEGQILISDATYSPIATLVQAAAKEAVFMKGIIEPIPLYEVTGTRVDSIDEARAQMRAGARRAT